MLPASGLRETSLRRLQSQFQAEFERGHRLAALCVIREDAKQPYNLKRLLEVAKLPCPEGTPDCFVHVTELWPVSIACYSLKGGDHHYVDVHVIGDRESRHAFGPLAANACRVLGVDADSGNWTRQLFRLARKREQGSPLQTKRWTVWNDMQLELTDDLDAMLRDASPEWRQGFGRWYAKAEKLDVSDLPDLFCASVDAIDILLHVPQTTSEVELPPMDRAIAGTLLSLSVKWATLAVEDLSHAQETALQQLTHAGLVEERLDVTATMDGFPEPVRIRCRVSGDYDKALRERIAYRAPDWIDADGTTRNRYTIAAANLLMARLTAEGEAARRAVEKGELSHVVWFLWRDRRVAGYCQVEESSTETGAVAPPRSAAAPSPAAKAEQSEGGDEEDAPQKVAQASPKRGRKVKKDTIRWADFAKPLRVKGEKWASIYAEYLRTHPREVDATADKIRLAFERQYPDLAAELKGRTATE